MSIKDLAEFDDKVWKYLLACVVVCVSCFLAGRYTAPKPTEDSICGARIRSNKELTAKVSSRDQQIVRLKADLKTCQDDTDSRIQKKIDEKDAECETKVSEAIEKQKKRYLGFKCRTCIQEGYCK